MFKRDIFFIFFRSFLLTIWKVLIQNQYLKTMFGHWLFICWFVKKCQNKSSDKRLENISNWFSIENAFLFLIFYSGLLFFIWFDFEWKKSKKVWMIKERRNERWRVYRRNYHWAGKKCLYRMGEIHLHTKATVICSWAYAGFHVIRRATPVCNAYTCHQTALTFNRPSHFSRNDP